MIKTRKIFFVVAGGGHETDRHYYDTIEKRKSVDEFAKFLKPEQEKALRSYSRGRPYAIWGAVPGSSNKRLWETMEEGDYVMIYRKGKIILAAEIAMKIQNADLARYFWKEDEDGKTWEYTYFMINDVPFDLNIEKFNEYIGFEKDFKPRGFSPIKQERVNRMLSEYGDLISLLHRLSGNEKLEKIEYEKRQIINDVIDDRIDKIPTEHTEIQWRLIRLGNKSSFDVWVPAADQSKEFDGNKFREFVIKEFQETIDIPGYIKNIDTVWKLGHAIKSAFEIEHSTSIYSGILRLSDLRTLTPNSIYPLFIVADRERKSKVFEQLRRPTFSSDYLSLDRVVRFLSYDSIRELDEETKKENMDFNMNWLVSKAESVS